MYFEYTMEGLTGGKKKASLSHTIVESGTQERPLSTPIADSEWTQSIPRADANFEEADPEKARSRPQGSALILCCVRSILVL